jgi:hypothetical protein
MKVETIQLDIEQESLFPPFKVERESAVYDFTTLGRQKMKVPFSAMFSDIRQSYGYFHGSQDLNTTPSVES